MKFRLGLAAGLVIGFLLGARAGRERYEQIMAALQKMRSSEKVSDAADIAERSTRGARASTGRTMVSLADTVRARATR